MKKFVKILAIVLAIALSATLLYACGDKNTSGTGETSADADAPVVEKLIMGTNAAFPPYEYYEGDKIVGIDAEVGALIAEKLGMELEIKDMDFGGIISAVENGVVDIGMAGMTVNEERLLQVDFSTSYAKGVQVVIVKEGSNVATLDDLAGKKIVFRKQHPATSMQQMISAKITLRDIRTAQQQLQLFRAASLMRLSLITSLQRHS